MEQELEQLEGTVEDIIYENSDNGYTVFEVSGGGVMTVVCGVVGHAQGSGSRVRVPGQPLTALYRCPDGGQDP